MASWDRTKAGLKNLRWKIKNPRNQRASIGLTGPQVRMFKDNTCKSSKKLDNVVFRLQSATGKTIEGAENNKKY
jgi:hypothetical protein